MSNLKERIDLVMQNLPISMEELNSKYVSRNEVPYIQHTPDSVEKTQADFLKICDEVLKSDYYTTGKIHRQGIIGRYLDDCGVSELYSTWTRFMCIDEQYREWSQPYYAHPDKVKESDMLCINTLEPELISYFRDKKLEQILIESELQKSVRNLLKIKEDQKRLDDFAHKRYNEEYPRDPNSYGYHHYDAFKVIDENTIRVFFKYGAGVYDYDGSFDIDMRPYYREEKINI